MASYVVTTVSCIALVIAGAVWVIEWRKGERTLRDERDRFRPVPALALVVAGLIVLGASATLVV